MPCARRSTSWRRRTRSSRRVPTLPEAQLDRFFLQVNVDYPSVEAERRMMIATTTGAEDRPQRVIDGPTLAAMQRLVRRMPIGDRLIDMILRLVRAGRPTKPCRGSPSRSLGARTPRQPSLMLAVRVRALLGGRLAPSVEDVMALARPVLRHRMAVSFAARAEGITVEDVVEPLPACRLTPRRRRASAPGAQAPASRETLSQRLPALLVEAEQVAATVARACTGGGAPAWARRSGSSASTRRATPPRRLTGANRPARHLFVREQGGEAAESVWIWCDFSNSMAFRSAPSCR